MKPPVLLKKRMSKLKENFDEYFNKKSANGQSHMAKWPTHWVLGHSTYMQ